MYKKVNTVQLLLHGLGVFGGIWMLLGGWHYYFFLGMAIPFALLPVILEVSVLFSVIRFNKINSHIKKVIDDENYERKRKLEGRGEARNNNANDQVN